MNRNYYLIGILFLTIHILAVILQSFVLLKQGFLIRYLQSYAYWYLVFTSVYVIIHVFILFCFRDKQWRFTFYAGLVLTILLIAQFVLTYYSLISVTRELEIYNTLLYAVSIVGGIVMGFGYIFSAAGQNKLLKALGVLMVIFGALFSVTFWQLNFVAYSEFTLDALIYLHFFSGIFTVFYVLFFYNEMRSTPPMPFTNFQTGIGIVAAVASIATAIIGGQLAMESYWSTDWQQRGPAEARRLAERFEARIFLDHQGDTLHYLLLKPLDYDSTMSYPIVTCLHGGPTRVAGNVEVTQPAPLLSEYENRKKHPTFLFVPQGRPGVLWGGIPGVPSMEALVLEAAASLEREFSIDTTRRYIAGISGGGYGSWHFISSHPDMFAAAIPICGAGDPRLAKLIVHVPVWAFHGDADRNVSVTGSRNMIEALRNAGGNPKYNEFPGVGHNVWPEVEKTEGVWDWLFAQRRQ